jgi:cytidine deaminase
VQAESVKAALAALDRAYAPYSKHRVGAALETKDGRIFAGCNVENASYGLTICAERSAVFAAVAAGETRFAGIVIVSSTGRPTPPCGACRQVLAEFAQELEVVMVGGKTEKRAWLSSLLPDAFRKR